MRNELRCEAGILNSCSSGPKSPMGGMRQGRGGLFVADPLADWDGEATVDELGWGCCRSYRPQRFLARLSIIASCRNRAEHPSSLDGY